MASHIVNRVMLTPSAHTPVNDAVRISLIKDSLSAYSPRSAAASIVLRAMSGTGDGPVVMSRIDVLTKSVTHEVVAEVEVLVEKYALAR